MKHKRQKMASGNQGGIELNVMPFIDVFSLLCTFLLFSAVFVAIGILEVQVPFFSNTPPPPNQKNERELEVTVDVSVANVKLTTSFSMPPVEKSENQYPNAPAGLEQLHQKLVQLKRDNPKADRIKFFSDDDVIFSSLTAVIDKLKNIEPGDQLPPANQAGLDGKVAVAELFSKIIMGNVIL